MAATTSSYPTSHVLLPSAPVRRVGGAGNDDGERITASREHVVRPRVFETQRRFEVVRKRDERTGLQVAADDDLVRLWLVRTLVANCVRVVVVHDRETVDAGTLV